VSVKEYNKIFEKEFKKIGKLMELDLCEDSCNTNGECQRIDPKNFLTIRRGTNNEEDSSNVAAKTSMLNVCEYNYSGRECEQ